MKQRRRGVQRGAGGSWQAQWRQWAMFIGGGGWRWERPRGAKTRERKKKRGRVFFVQFWQRKKFRRQNSNISSAKDLTKQWAVKFSPKLSNTFDENFRWQRIFCPWNFYFIAIKILSRQNILSSGLFSEVKLKFCQKI